MSKPAEEALRSILWYNSYIEIGNDDDWVSRIIRRLEEKKARDEFCSWADVLDIDPKIQDWGSEEHTIWMMLVGMFGDWGTSIRSGWIEEIDECVEYLRDTKMRK